MTTFFHWPVLFLVGLLTAAPAPAQPPAPASRVIAVGDIHGAFDEFRTLLRTAGVTDT